MTATIEPPVEVLDDGGDGCNSYPEDSLQSDSFRYLKSVGCRLFPMPNIGELYDTLAELHRQGEATVDDIEYCLCPSLYLGLDPFGHVSDFDLVLKLLKLTTLSEVVRISEELSSMEFEAGLIQEGQWAFFIENYENLKTTPISWWKTLSSGLEKSLSTI